MNKHLEKAVKSVARYFLAVEKLNDPELEEMRMNTCMGCDKFRQDNKTCNECGCWMDVKTGLKTNRDPDLAGEIVETHCPLGRWGDVELANQYREEKGLPLLNIEQ
mgnify:CR=1 FL=1